MSSGLEKPRPARYDLYTRLYLWLWSHRWLVLSGTLLITVLGLIISSRLVLEEDVLAILPQGDRRVDDYQYALRKFRQIDQMYFDISVEETNAASLGPAADTFYARLATNRAFARITYRIEITGPGRVLEFLTGSLPNLLTAADAEALAPMLEPAAIREHLLAMRRKLGGLEGMVLKDVVAADPVGMSALVVAKVMPLQAGFGDAHIEEGRIVSGDGRHVLLLAEPKQSSSNSRANVELVGQVLAAARAVEQEFPGLQIALTGGHRMAVDNAALIKGDATRCLLLGMAAMLILCLSAFRRRWLAAIAFLPSFFGTLMAVVVLALWEHQLSGLATGFATIAIAITVDYAIYVIYHLDDAAGLDRPGVGRHVSQLVMPITVGALTTVVAFVVMTTSPMHGYQQLGVFGAAGVVFSAAFALFILPLLVPIPRASGQPPLWLTRWLERALAWQQRQRPWLLVAVLLLSVVTAFGLRRLRFDGDITRLNGVTAATRQDENLIRQTWGETIELTLLVARGTNVEAALEQNDRAATVLKSHPGISGVFSLAAVCPSSATQQQNVRRWRDFWSPARRADLRAALERIGPELGFRPDAFSPFWQRLDSEPPPVTLETFRGTPLERALDERVALGTNDNAISTLVKLEDRAQLPRLRAELPDMIVLDHRDFALHIAGLAKEGLRHFAFWTAIFVALILYLSHPSLELVLATLLPLGFGLLWTFGAMGWLGLPIDLMNSVFVIFIIGVGEDYGIFLVSGKLDEWRGQPRRLGATTASVVISALTTLFGFAVLVFAQHPVLFSMGTTVLLGMGFAFAATMILTPWCMDLLLFRPPPTGAPRWWHFLGTIWVTVHLGGSQLFLYYLLRPILKLIGPATADDRLRRATRFLARGVVKGLPYGRLEFQNLSKQTFERPSIVISNHQSAVDVMLVVSLPGDVRQTAKKRVFDNPALGIGCKLLGHVMVEPNQPEITMRRCRDRLASGASVHFYPEGTRSPDGFIQRFHRGAFELAIELRQEIQPIILCDSWTAMPRDSYWFEPCHVTVSAIPRITPATFDYSQGSLALMRHCEAIVREAFQRKLDEINTPAVLRRKVRRLYRYQGKFVEQFAYWKLRADPVFPALDRVVPRRGLVLDLGCGYGLATHWLAHTTDQRSFLGVDYDEGKIRVARLTAPRHPRIRFEHRDLLEWDYPACASILLLDVLHYWAPEKQQLILDHARRALEPGGRLVLREAARDESAGHRRVSRWERLATGIGHNRTYEGLHFQTLESLTSMLRTAGFASWQVERAGGLDSNVLLIAEAH